MSTGNTALSAEGKGESISRENLALVLELLRTIKYGTVSLVIQDGKVVQVDKLEKIRF
jgi:hypothetical protein